METMESKAFHENSENAATIYAFKSLLVVKHVCGSVVVNCFTFWNLTKICEESLKIFALECLVCCMQMGPVDIAALSRIFVILILDSSLLLWGLHSQKNVIFWHFGGNFFIFFCPSTKCGMLVYANGSSGDCRDPLVELCEQAFALLMPASQAGKTKPTSCASFTAVKSNQTFFLLSLSSFFKQVPCGAAVQGCI